MSQNFIPMLSYEDGLAAMDWLTLVLDGKQKERWLDDNGQLTHGELELDGQVVMMATPTELYESPKSVRAKYAPAAELAKVPYVMDGVLVYVPNLQEVYDRAVAKGAIILSEIIDGPPALKFRMEDPEGHRWYVMQAG